MAINFFNQVDLNQNQLKQAAINNVTSDPTTGVLGELIYNTSNNSLKVCTTAYNPATNPVTDAVYTAVGAGVDSISAAAGSFVTFTNADFVDEAGDVDFGSFDLSATAVSGNIDNTKYLRGDNKWAELPSSDNYEYWTFGSDNNVSGYANVDSKERVNFTGGNVISTTAITINGSPFTLQISHDDLTVTQATGTALDPGYGGTVDVVTSVTTTAQGHVDTITTTEVEWPAAEAYDFKVDGDASSSAEQTIGNGETLQFNGSSVADAAGISIIAKATDILEFRLDGSLIDDVSSLDDPTTDSLLVFEAGTDNKKVVVSDIHINEFGDAEGVVNMGDGTSNFQIKNMADPTDDQDAVTKSYADGLLSSALQFKGTFNAATGLITGSSPAAYLYQLTGGSFDSSKARVKVEVGDLYIVDTAGDFYANTATPLTPGDQVFGQKDAAADASVESDWAVVQSDTDEATYAAIGIGNVNANSSSVTGYTGGNGGPSQSGTGILDVAYTTGTANLSIRNASATVTGVGKVANSDGSISVSYAADGTATLAVSGNSNGFRVALNNTTPSTRSHSGGITSYTIDVSDSSLYGGSQAAIDIKAEVMTAAGQTVYADVTRNASNLIISFVDPSDTIANTDYEVLIVRA